MGEHHETNSRIYFRLYFLSKEGVVWEKMKFENIDENPVEVDIEKTIGLIRDISKKIIEINKTASMDDRIENNRQLVDLMGALTQTYQHKLTQSNYDTILRLCDEFNIPN